MEIPRKSDWSRLNRAYGCFAFVGLATLPVGVGISLSVLHWMNFDEGSTGGTLAMLFGIGLAPLLFLGITAASFYGIWQTLHFRHPALIVLSVVSIAGGGLIVLLLNTPAFNGGQNLPMVDYGMGIAFGIYIAANILIPAWWFTKGRRRYRNGAYP